MVTLVSVVSRYPLINRRFPAWSVIGVRQVLLELQVTVAPEGAPVSSTNARPVARDAPVALFQFVLGRTPALSATPMDVPVPTKWIPMARPELAAPTTRSAVALWFRDPLVPEMVSVDVPAGVPAAVVTVSVALPAPSILAGLNEAVALAGSPLTARFTVPVNPFTAPIVTV